MGNALPACSGTEPASQEALNCIGRKEKSGQETRNLCSWMKVHSQKEMHECARRDEDEQEASLLGSNLTSP